MNNKRSNRIRRGRKTRLHIKKIGAETGIDRMNLFKSPRHIYAQVISAENGNVMASASSIDKELRKDLKGKTKTEVAVAVGKLLAQRAKQAGIQKLASDRSGFKYHGRIKALVDTVREEGITV